MGGFFRYGKDVARNSWQGPKYRATAQHQGLRRDEGDSALDPAVLGPFTMPRFRRFDCTENVTVYSNGPELGRQVKPNQHILIVQR